MMALKRDDCRNGANLLTGGGNWGSLASCRRSSPTEARTQHTVDLERPLPARLSASPPSTRLWVRKKPSKRVRFAGEIPTRGERAALARGDERSGDEGVRSRAMPTIAPTMAPLLSSLSSFLPLLFPGFVIRASSGSDTRTRHHPGFIPPDTR